MRCKIIVQPEQLFRKGVKHFDPIYITIREEEEENYGD